MEMQMIFNLLVAVGIAFLFLSLLWGRASKKSYISWLKDDVVKDEGKKAPFNNIMNFISDSLSYKSKDIKDKFIAAGYYEPKYYWLYIPAKITLISLIFLCFFVLDEILGLASLGSKTIYAVLLLLAIILLPDMFLAAKKKLLIEKISDRLPYLLDLMGVCVQTGMTIEATFSYLAIEMRSFDRDIAHILKKTNDRAQIVGLDKALNELLQRVPSNEMRSFVYTLKQSMKYGSSIYEVLTTLAKDIREVQMLGLEEKIGKLSAKMSIPLILFIMFPIVILIAAPGVMRMMANV